MQLLRGRPWSVRYKLEQEMAESVGAPPFFLNLLEPYA
jgi:hypothetical protein